MKNIRNLRFYVPLSLKVSSRRITWLKFREFRFQASKRILIIPKFPSAPVLEDLSSFLQFLIRLIHREPDVCVCQWCAIIVWQFGDVVHIDSNLKSLGTRFGGIQELRMRGQWSDPIKMSWKTSVKGNISRQSTVAAVRSILSLTLLEPTWLFVHVKAGPLNSKSMREQSEISCWNFSIRHRFGLDPPCFSQIDPTSLKSPIHNQGNMFSRAIWRKEL